MKIRIRHIALIFTLLVFGGIANDTRAAKVTYHILTLPIDNSIYHMSSAVAGHRLEAVKVVVDNQSTVELPAHYKSPLVANENFTYYKPEDITIGGSALQLYDNNTYTKGILYDVKASPKPVAEGSVIAGTTAEYYVVYTYNTSNTIAKLDGSVDYNIEIKNKGYLAYNRGRNNRPAVVPSAKVNPEIISSPDFIKIDNPGGGITTYWSSNDNKNKKEDVESQFHFIFRFEGQDPYNIIICTAYNRDLTFIEKNENTNNFVYKEYKGGQLISAGTANAFIASDTHKMYTEAWSSSDTENKTNPAYEAKNGYLHGITKGGAIWGTVALLNNINNNGYVFMGTRTVDGSGAVPTPGTDNKYYYLNFANNNLTFGKYTSSDATNNNSTAGIYPIKKLTFKVATPFYKVEPTNDHIISVSDQVSQQTVANTPIETKYLPAALKREFCNWNGKFYKNPACTDNDEITYFSEATEDPTEGYQVYVGYNVSNSIPFKGITPKATYDATTWNNATWYELTDENSTQEYGKKLKYDGRVGEKNFKNNGANGDYAKTSEFAFIGDPYELRVVYRDATSGATPSYVGATGTPDSETNLTVSTTATAGYKWQIADDKKANCFLLQLYKGTGRWSWDAGHPSDNVTYESDLAYSAGKDAQTITFNVSGLNGSKYIKVTTGGTHAAQIVSVSPTANTVAPETGTTATVTVKLAENTDTENPKTMTVTIQEYNDNEGNSANGTASVITITQGTSSSAFAGNTVQYSTSSSTYVKVMELPKRNYTYNIVDVAGNIAIKGTTSQTIYSPLTKASIPSSILSPYLADETVTFFSSFTEGDRSHLSSPITETPVTNNADIYVSYTTGNLARKSIHLDNDQRFKVQLNGEYIYWDSDESKILSTETVGTDVKFSWQLEGKDPYAMKIYNVGKGEYVKVTTWGNSQALEFDSSIDNASRFIAMMSNYSGIYEVMAATGTTDYYHIGRLSNSGAETKIYSYAHGADELRFVLSGEQPVHYHLIDKTGAELLEVSSYNARLTLPAEYISPLVDTYYYYPTSTLAATDDHTSNISEIDADTKEDGTQTEDFKGDYHVYVTYTVNDLIGFNNTGRVNDHPYLLRFLDPFAAGYYLEDGNDKLTSSLIQAVYPYCNGDGNLNIYGTRMRNEQMDGGSSTRPRWVWFFESANNDPYHVRIHSRSTISFNSVNNPTYLETKAVHFNQDADANTKHIITGGSLPGIASTAPTEYMVLGLPGAYKLVTTDKIDDGSTNEHRTVVSFEQYWKTYNMVKLDVLGISNSTDAFSNDESTWKVPTTDNPETAGVNESTYRTTLAERGWHSYDAYANATRWNGYNDKEDGHTKKVVEKLEHWFQTFDMGDGTFDVEDADIPPVLVLLDRHGWEIMRKPLPTTNYPEGVEELEALRVYDSPLVDRYYFYSNATKASGCHKYSLRLNDKGEERDQIKVNGVHYSSSSLGDLPPANASGVKSSGVLNDQFVIYTVKEEYEDNYSYTLDYTETKDGDKVTGYTVTSETGISQPYFVIQNGRFYKIENNNVNHSYISKPIIEHTNPSGGNIDDLIVSPTNYASINILNGANFIGNNFWYIKPNLNIDEEMGIIWGTSISGAEPLSEVATKVTHYKNKQSGFDPYNMQLQLVKKNDGETDGRYLTTHITSANRVNGVLVADYTGTDYYGNAGSTMVTLEEEFTSYDPNTYKNSEGYDHTNLQISNQTFMAVSDANGNMQLMPRFDHNMRVDLEKVNPWETKLKAPENHAKASVDDNNSMGPQTTFFVRPQRFIYHIIDNNGCEALRYTRGGDYYPSITKHFKSPLATDFTYYSGLAEAEAPAESTAKAWTDATEEFKRTATSEDMLTDLIKLLPMAGTYQYRIGTRGAFTYKSVVVTKGLLEKEITGSFAAENLNDVDCDVYVRYNYDEEADRDADRILEGQWFTVKLADKDLQAYGTIVTKNDESTTDVVEVPGTGVSLYTGTKPGTINENKKEWQWKFLQAPTDPSSDYYEAPDPYAIRIFNRQSNYTNNPTVEPSPMAVGIKVPHATDGTDTDRFALLSHPNGGYALIVAKTYTNSDYLFLNGGSMTAPDASPASAATTATEASFNYKNGIISDDAKVLVNNDVVFHYTYNVITNEKIVSEVNVGNKLAITAEQDNAAALSHDFNPYLPESAQTPLLNMEDYVYYGFVSRSGDTYSVIPQTKLYTLYGLYDDIVYVRYDAYDVDKTNFKVPNMKDVVDSKVARHSDSHDVSMNINGELPYNIIWEDDNMMQSVDDTNTISDGGSQSLSGNENYVWYFEGNDPYALKIKHKKTGSYVDGSTTLVDEANAQEFMLLKKDGYDYGILQVTGTTGSNAGKKLTGYGGELTADVNTAPTKFIIFGLSVNKLIYRLVIAETCSDTTVTDPPIGQYVDIPFRAGTEASPSNILTYKRIYGTTQRDLKSENTGAGTHLAGEKYQLGSTLCWGNENHTYSHDAKSVSIGDDLWVPNIFYRPNCTFEFYIEGIYNTEGTTEVTELNDKFKGLKLRKLMSDSELIDKTVVVNIVYSFDKTLATNNGLDFVRSLNQNFWYTFETPSGETPYLAHYTNAWGLQTMEGRETRYTNDYLWSPLGDVYGFKLYNRYMNKTSGRQDNVMTMDYIDDNENLYMAVPGTSTRPDGADVGTEIPTDYAIFELLPGDKDGYYRVHPVANNSDPRYYVNIDASGYTVLRTTPVDWVFGLDLSLMRPYYDRAGYVGGLTPAGKTAYETALNKENFHIIDLQAVVYNDANIIPFTPGYYRLHSQPGLSGISPVRYASGYLHDTEKTAGESSTAIPMHFYSKKGVSTTFTGEDGLGSGFTVTDATRGEIPILATENDPSTIFYFPGNETRDSYGNPTSTIQTQGLYVAANANGDAANGTTTSKLQRAVMTDNSANAVTFSVMDIGGAVLLIHDGAAPPTRRYLNFDQSNTTDIYDLKYYHESPADDAKWCMQPVQKTATVGNGEMPLTISTNNGGDGYYYTTFYAPFDVLLPTDVEAVPSKSITAKTYNAYICKKWHDEGVNPSPVPASGSYAEGKFVPAETPVIIRVKDESGSVTLTLPSTSPPSPSPLTSVLKGSYLEKLLAVDASHDVYVLGLPMISEEVDKASDYVTSGDITAPLPEYDNDEVGFYINATPNKEHNPLKSLWTRNNRYVLHNKVYYRGGNANASAPRRDVPIFVPVIFDDEEDLDPTEENNGSQGDEGRSRFDNNIYDLQGRCVATEEEVADGSWRYRLPAGIYIHHGKKIMIGK